MSAGKHTIPTVSKRLFDSAPPAGTISSLKISYPLGRQIERPGRHGRARLSWTKRRGKCDAPPRRGLSQRQS
jgi:hypothetical protein